MIYLAGTHSMESAEKKITCRDQKQDAQLTITALLCSVLFCSSAVVDPRVGHTMDVSLLSPFIYILCHSD